MYTRSNTDSCFQTTPAQLSPSTPPSTKLQPSVPLKKSITLLVQHLCKSHAPLFIDFFIFLLLFCSILQIHTTWTWCKVFSKAVSNFWLQAVQINEQRHLRVSIRIKNNLQKIFVDLFIIGTCEK